ncbi:GHKL domain-containing protein [Lutispora sp.]|nr:GHKL domain-containing protein [Lutispora sp.]MEA4964076.1 GHKL domain-containing protein [Lutispora sp.]
MAFALMTFIVTAINVLVYNKYIELIDKRLMLMNIFITSAYFILTMAVYRVYSNLVVNEQENKQLRVYINMADELIDEYRRVRHNTYNIIQAASAFIEENDMEGLKEHFSSVIERQRRIEKSNIASLYKIAHPGVKSLLSSKLGRIEALSLNLNLEITTDLREVKVNISDLCEILGVFLDNSIEASGLTKEKYIEICMFEDDQYYITIIKNSYDPNHGKKGNGIGLRTVNSILRKYGLMLNNTIIEEKYYIQELIIKKFN